ncbi:MAG: hypothetical protein WD336_05000, partial [Trueperaceae bacterium]
MTTAACPPPASAPAAGDEGTATPADACAFVIFGVTGDLAARKLMPALWTLHRQGSLHPETRIVGYARSDGDDASLRRDLRNALHEHHGEVSDDAWAELASRIHYVRGGYDDADGHADLAERLQELRLARRLFYTATPPDTYAGIAEAMDHAGLCAAPEGGWV